jgi:hypothetical protein
MLRWLQEHQSVLFWLAVVSVGGLVVSALATTWVVGRLPADYFTHKRRPRPALAHRHPALRIALRVGKNLLGVVLVVAGAAMLVLPGQGVLTLFIGLLLLDIPGKYRVERWFVSRPSVGRAINWLRRRTGRPPLKSLSAARGTKKRSEGAA